MLELHAVRGGVEAEAGIAGDEHVAGRQHLRALAPHDDVVTCEEGFYYSFKGIWPEKVISLPQNTER